MASPQRIAVIGRGMIGSAAARHLAEAGHDVVLVGSGEPADYSAAAAPFASHYDSGRITRISSANPYWAELAARSIRRYADITERSGIAFHNPRGLAQASSVTDEAIAAANARGGRAEEIDPGWLRDRTGIAVRADHPGRLFFEHAPAGVIDPRRLVRAQVRLAALAGATIVDAPATAIRRTGQSFAIEAGTQIDADQILLATGAYGAQLIGIDLVLQPRLRTIVFADLGPGLEIPTFIDDAPAHPDLEEIYWVPPVRFPDGRVLLKIGGNSLPMITAESPEDIGRWFAAGGSRAEAEPLQATVRALLPDADIAAWDHKPCVVTYTPTELPYLGFIDDGVAIATGASGSGAKSSDEIGRLAASILQPSGWDGGPLDIERFRPQLSI